MEAEEAMNGSETTGLGFGKKSGPQHRECTDLDNPFLHMAHSPSPPPPYSQVTASQRSPRYYLSALLFWDFSLFFGISHHAHYASIGN